MTIATTNHFQNVFSKILKFGFLLESDPKVPSVCGLITGEALKGSWWSHPMAQIIFAVNERLEDHPAVLITKLVSRKVTFIHRNIWPEILAIGSVREPWQFAGLSSAALELLRMVDAQGILSTEKLDLPKTKTSTTEKPGDVARDLERKLLVHSTQFHTESGKHAKRLETWEHWSKRTGVVAGSITATKAKIMLEERLQKLNEQSGGKAQLPWMKTSHEPTRKSSKRD